MVLSPVVTTSERRAHFNFTAAVGNVDLVLMRCKYCTQESRAKDYGRHTTHQINQEYTVGVVRDDEVLSAMSLTNKGEALQHILQTEGIMLGSVVEGLDRVRNGQLQLVMDSETASFYEKQAPCDLSVVDTLGMSYTYSFAMSKEHDHFESLDEALHVLRRNLYLWDALRAPWFPEGCGNNDPHRDLIELDSGFGSTQTTDIPHFRVTTTLVKII